MKTCTCTGLVDHNSFADLPVDRDVGPDADVAADVEVDVSAGVAVV